LEYLSGFGNEFQSAHKEYPDAVPEQQNNPQKCPYGLYAEQLSGTAFTAPRSSNRRTWLYRIRPSVLHTPFQPMANRPKKFTNKFDTFQPNPNRNVFGTI
jgi:homogentisate 1,2-dioxygenase